MAIYLPRYRNPFLAQAPSIMANMIMQQMSQKYQSQERAKERDYQEQQQRRLMLYEAGKEGRDIVRTGAQKPPEGYTQLPGDTTTYIGPKPIEAQNQFAYKPGELKEFPIGDERTVYGEYVGGNKVYQIPGSKKVMPPGWRPTDLGKSQVKPNLSPEAFKNADKLRDEFTKQSGTFVDVRDAYRRVQASGENPSAAGDLALIFNYMKILDPGSTVREGEFATAQNAASIPERIRAMYNKVARGERLSDEQRKDFVSRAGKLFGRQEQAHKQLRSEYDRLARAFNIEPSHVIVNYLMTNEGGVGGSNQNQTMHEEKRLRQKYGLEPVN